MKFTRRQKIAILNPCYAAEETTHPAFRSTQGPCSVVLTLNSGFE